MTRVAEGLQEEHRPFVGFPPDRSAASERAKSKPTKAPRKVCLMVLGMHHSGTDAFARVLNLLGCDLPKSVAPASEGTRDAEGDAAEEPDAVRQLNDRILASAGTRWDDWLEFHPGWLQSPRAEEFRDEALELMGREFGASRLFVLEDPRMCRLVPFWLGVLKEAGVRPLILSPVRSPLAVAAALEERDGFAPGLGHLMWLRYVLDAEFASRGTRRFFTSHDQLTSGWARTTTAAASTLGVAWPRLSDKTAVEIEEFLSRDRGDDRQQAGNNLDNPTLSDWLRSTSEILRRWSLEGEAPQDHARLDDIRAAMNTAAPAFARLLGTAQARTARLELELASEREQASRLSEELESRAAAAETQLAGERQQVSQLRQELESRAAAAEQELAGERKLKQELESRAAAAEQELAGERKLKQELESRAAAIEQELSGERKLKQDLESRAAAAEQELAGERKLKQDLESRAEAAEQELAGERKLKQDLESRAEAAEKELAGERKLKHDLENRAAVAEQELARQRQRQDEAAAEAESALSELRHRLAQTESALAQRSHEAEQTASELAAAREELRQADAARAAAEAARVEADKISAGLKQHLDLLLADMKHHQVLAAERAEADAALAGQVRQVLAVLDTSRHELAARLSAAERASATRAAELQRRTVEVEALKKTVEEAQGALHHQLSEAERLRRLAGLEIGRAAGLVDANGNSVLPRRLRLMWRAIRLKRSGLFDAEWYLRHNTDVAEAGIDPLRHYMEFGAREGRAPNPGLVTPNGKP